MTRQAALRDDATDYERDLFAWTETQAALLRARRAGDLDWDNLAEEIESVGRSEKREVRHRLQVLLAHLLKWQFQPDRRCNSWQSSIGEQRTHIRGVIETSPSLARFPAEALSRAYQGARREAQSETGLPHDTFPAECAYAVDEILDFRFMPGTPWHPDDLIRD